MARITRDDMLMSHAKVASLRGTCSRLRVGAVFSIEGRIITTGYNGVARGLDHCRHPCISPLGTICIKADCPQHSAVGCLNAQHAERNAIDFAACYGLALKGSEVHVTHSPCLQCASSLINVGITRVTYAIQYRSKQGVELLETKGVEINHIVDLGKNS